MDSSPQQFPTTSLECIRLKDFSYPAHYPHYFINVEPLLHGGGGGGLDKEEEEGGGGGGIGGGDANVLHCVSCINEMFSVPPRSCSSLINAGGRMRSPGINGGANY
ncbi:hypothetical protein fugu_019450 [Takifugu bimaculatus]|uniref:Uncharacterized protein n=1 Tax=Takifugu bimaculatus TaxID=433685 RepID=A0A4Z2BL86_9TELE|nr:hypothetical protein fugu_019450 [Takifugu bimaculatus]